MAEQEKNHSCLYCKKEFAVATTGYGWGIPCPHCHKKLDIFPDIDVFLYFKGEPIGIAFVKEEGGALSHIIQICRQIMKVVKG